MSKLVYLSGPITGLSYDGCTDWREYAVKSLAEAGLTGLSPLRAKTYLQGIEKIGDSYEDIALSCSRGITTRDRWDTIRSDVLLVNLLGAERVSIGTVIEMAWADLSRVPIILVIEPSVLEATGTTPSQGNVHEHAMVREMAGFRVETLDEGIHIAKALLA